MYNSRIREAKVGRSGVHSSLGYRVGLSIRNKGTSQERRLELLLQVPGNSLLCSLGLKTEAPFSTVKCSHVTGSFFSPSGLCAQQGLVCELLCLFHLQYQIDAQVSP